MIAEYLILKSHVEMHLYMDGKNGFLVGGPEAIAKTAPAAKPGEKAHVMIQTAGSMIYDLTKEKEQAQFDAPPTPPGAGPAQVEPVRVTRTRVH